MTEDAGKKRFIKDFLKNVEKGAGYVEEIRIERIVRTPGSEAQGSIEGTTARSFSGNKVSNITALLEDDIKHTFDEGFFTFRFVAAFVGSGKTSLLTYLHELTKTKPTYQNHSVVIQFQLSDVAMGRGFREKLYSHIIALTFYELLHNSNVLDSVRNEAEKILSDFLDNAQVAQLKVASKLMPFRNKFKNYINNNIDSFEELFFYIISEVSSVDPKFSFVYLIDELDALAEFKNEIQETRLLFKELVRRGFQDFKSKIRLLIYLVGTSVNIGTISAGDAVIDSLVGDWVINLYKGHSNEFELIRAKIDERIKGAYSGYKDFTQAWEEIQNIQINPSNTLREFCRNYAGALLKIHEKYFKEAPEQCFEGDARELIKSQCRQKWANYLKNQSAYKLSDATTTTKLAGHAFDCYVQLLHNNNCVARAFGEAKNYELVIGHLETFKQWLKDVDFKPHNSDGHPPDLAFMIAPSCPSLLKRKLELQNIQFIPANKEKEDDPVIKPEKSTTETKSKIENPKLVNINTDPEPISKISPVNINTADKDSLITAFRGTGVHKTTIHRLTKQREESKYTCLKDLVSRLKFNDAVTNKLQEKLDKSEICF